MPLPRPERRAYPVLRRPPMTESIGWLSSAVLVVTIAQQVYKQWRDGTSEGVSRWLFLGQMLASVGFTLYSWQVRNWVFVVTNGLMLLSAVVGYAIVLKHQKHQRRCREPRHGERVSTASSARRAA